MKTTGKHVQSLKEALKSRRLVPPGGVPRAAQPTPATSLPKSEAGDSGPILISGS